jgi:hypothetical protein
MAGAGRRSAGLQPSGRRQGRSPQGQKECGRVSASAALGRAIRRGRRWNVSLEKRTKEAVVIHEAFEQSVVQRSVLPSKPFGGRVDRVKTSLHAQSDSGVRQEIEESPAK